MALHRFSRLATLLQLATLVCLAQEPDIKIDKVIANPAYRFLSAPAWHHEISWVYANVSANQILHWVPGQKPEVLSEDAQGPSGMAFDPQGRLYVCEARGRKVVRIDKKKHVETIAEKWQGKRLNAPNDIAVRKDGNAYFTDPAFGYQQDNRELDFFGVYRLTSKGELDVIAKSTTRPNGIALSANGRTLFVSDSDKRSIRAYDLDRSGNASNERTLVSGVAGVPGGLCVDEKGSLYVMARNIEIYSADGKHQRTIEFAQPPSNCAFGDPDTQSLIVTSASSVFRIRLNVKGALQY